MTVIKLKVNGWSPKFIAMKIEGRAVEGGPYAFDKTND
jgi:hypothetical protein